MSEDALLRVEIAVLKEQLVATRDAIKKQAIEYERRLSELNHSHQQQIERNAQYVSREAWDARNEMIDTWRREVDKWRWVSIGAGGMIGGLISLILRFSQ